MMQDKKIDSGRAFDWGRASADYAKYRDIYPKEFYQKLLDIGMCIEGQKVLDIGTGTGVLPRHLYPYGAHFTGIDIAKEQIEQAIALAKNGHMKIDFHCTSAEASSFPNSTFDAVTACQCFTYFDHSTLALRVSDMLKPGGRFAVLYMAWLPFEDKIAGASEELVLKYNPVWTGCREERHLISIPSVYNQYFTIEQQDIFDVKVPFTRESWNGRMKACRGIEASLPKEEVARFDTEHRQLLEKIAPEEFEVLHYAAITTLQKRPE